jgi:arsenate reductase-like glutaredoxin family protein
MEKAKNYRNAKCGCSRKALEFVEYLKTPPSKLELGEIVKGLGIQPTIA